MAAVPTVQRTSSHGAKPIILDGGMGHQLKSMGVEISGPVGSMCRFLGVAMANLMKPELVVQAHLAFIDAGAEVVTTNSYSCVPRCLDHAPDNDENVVDLVGLIKRASELAREACAMRPARKAKVAGCLPPLADSYRPDKVGPYDENLRHYRQIVAAVSPQSDLLLCETMSTVAEAKAACAAALESGLPVWVAWTLDEKRPVLRSGESIQEAVAALMELPGIEASLQTLMFNCTSPEIICDAMPLLRKAAPSWVRCGGYANGFVTAASGSGEYRDLSPDEYFNDFVSKWILSGATVVGGCCGIFPPHIRAIHERLNEPTLYASSPASSALDGSIHMAPSHSPTVEVQIQASKL
eukprot:TRINITY_DN19681_c0_g6_i1.p1 TRINITY_DN19681_c0_g6~~TRINITY_DN19681_c0_g6_i1.p1  ORF type:complete len:353 (+),score=41.97 TRINITY_DN19681_c0_g6_i1:93-1151(+)